MSSFFALLRGSFNISIVLYFLHARFTGYYVVTCRWCWLVLRMFLTSCGRLVTRYFFSKPARSDHRVQFVISYMPDPLRKGLLVGKELRIIAPSPAFDRN